jgi:hypothetical protein
MSSSKKTPAADRSHGGPGSSQQDATQPEQRRHAREPAPGTPTNSRRSRISGGGGERDIHPMHDPAIKA